MALFGAGKITGVVVDCGSRTNRHTPIFEGYEMHHAIMKSLFSGDYLTSRFTDLIEQNNERKLRSFTDREGIDKMKTELCRVA